MAHSGERRRTQEFKFAFASWRTFLDTMLNKTEKKKPDLNLQFQQIEISLKMSGGGKGFLSCLSLAFF